MNTRSLVTTITAMGTHTCKSISYGTTPSNAIDNYAARLVLFLSWTGLFPECRNIAKHEMQSSALTFSQLLEAVLECSKIVRSMLNHCLLCAENTHECRISLPCLVRILSRAKNQSECEKFATNYPRVTPN